MAYKESEDTKLEVKEFTLQFFWGVGGCPKVAAGLSRTKIHM